MKSNFYFRKNFYNQDINCAGRLSMDGVKTLISGSSLKSIVNSPTFVMIPSRNRFIHSRRKRNRSPTFSWFYT